MLSKKDRAKLIQVLNTGLMLYVPAENRKPLAVYLADSLDVDFKDHFVQACLAE